MPVTPKLKNYPGSFRQIIRNSILMSSDLSILEHQKTRVSPTQGPLVPLPAAHSRLPIPLEQNRVLSK